MAPPTSLTSSYYDLLDAWSQEGCVVCNLLLRSADRFLDGLLYERVLDPDSHRAFRERLGLCNEHSWQATRYMGGSLGLAILYSTALDRVLGILDKTPTQAPPSGLARLFSRGRKASTLADWLEPSGPCIVCQAMAEAERRYLHTLGKHIADPRLGKAYGQSDGLCLPHFRLALREIQEPEKLALLISLQRDIWARLKADLEGLLDKSNYLRLHELGGREATSWRRAPGRLAGEKGVFGVDPRSD